VLPQDNTQLSSGGNQLNNIPTSQVHTNRVATTTNTGLDGTFKPRVRARRGQATDPHSIAERVSYCYNSYFGIHVESDENYYLMITRQTFNGGIFKITPA
jgi:hypothetical protein